jgi:hypothetical protein
MLEQNSSWFGQGNRGFCHRLAVDEVDADSIELFQKQGLARESAGIRRLCLTAAAVVFEMLTRRAGPERLLPPFLGHLIKHAL